MTTAKYSINLGRAITATSKKSYKKIGPIVAGISAASDFMTPVFNFSHYLLGFSFLLLVGTAWYWIKHTKPKVVKDAEESDTDTRETFLDSVTRQPTTALLAVSAIATFVFGLLVTGQLIFDKEAKGLMATASPKLADLQKVVLSIEARTKRIETVSKEIKNDTKEILANIRKRYTPEELQKLADHGAWKEILDNLQDVPVLDRDTDWEQTLFMAANGSLEMGGFDGAKGEYQYVKELLKKFPFLRKDKKFMKSRNQTFITYFSRCFYNKQRERDCRYEFDDQIAREKWNSDLMFLAASLSRRTLVRNFGAMQLAEIAVKGGLKRQDICNDQWIMLAVEEVMFWTLEGMKSYSEGRGIASRQPAHEIRETLEFAQTMGRDECWEKLKPEFVDYVSSREDNVQYSSDRREHLCPLLKEKDEYGPVIKERCQAYYKQKSEREKKSKKS